MKVSASAVASINEESRFEPHMTRDFQPPLAMMPRRPALNALFLLTALWGLIICSGAAAPIPSPEKLLPDDTLVVLTAPDFPRLKEVYRKSPQSQFWNDEAMRPFREKFLEQWREEVVKPLERDVNLSVKDCIDLARGQITFAVTRNGWQGKEGQPLGLLFLVDAKDKSSQLKTNLAALRKSWTEGGKPVRTEKIRDLEFMVLPNSSVAMPKSLQKFFPPPLEVQELGDDGDPKKQLPRSEFVIGQVDSLLVMGNSKTAVEKIAIRLTGGSLPALGDLAVYQANQQGLFRDAPVYGWVNLKAITDVMTRRVVETKDQDPPDALGTPKLSNLAGSLGLTGLKTGAFSLKYSPDGVLLQGFLAVPEASRQGIFKLLELESREAGPPPFVPADAVKFMRLRLDGQKTWNTFQRVVKDVSPQAANLLNFLIESANTNAKDPGFDIKKNLIGNLGDDVITYEKAPRSGSTADFNSAPSLFLLGSPNPEQLLAALKGLLTFLSAQNGGAAEREFLGRKVYSMPMPSVPMASLASSKPAAPRTLNYAASGGYVAFSTDVSLLEEYLRSTESQAKTLRETPELIDVAQKVGGTGTGLFAYQNQVETIRATFEMLRKDSGGATNITGLTQLPASLGFPTPQFSPRDWFDFSLLPPFERVAKYFHFTVYAGSANVDGLWLKYFAPVPPGLKGAAISKGE
jgi:hypothetical protein